MAETNLGVGQQKSLVDVVRIVEDTIRRDHGTPQKVMAATFTTEIAAEREDFDAPWTSFKILLRDLDEETSQGVEQALASHQDVATQSEEDGVRTIAITGEAEVAALAVDAVSEVLSLPEVWTIRGDKYRSEHISPELIFKAMIKYHASDCHLDPGESPVFRVDGETRGSGLYKSLSGEQIRALIRELATTQYWEEFERDMQTSFNFHQVGLGYSRVSAFMKAGAPHVTIRFLPEKVPSFEDLHVPHETMVELASLHHGLVLVTGMTGSGKSTTVAALVDWINTHKHLHILTIENPVEYVHHNKKSIISQRSTGIDVRDFNMAVTGALRHDPDVIVIGEMRDPDTIRSAINAAATGHLVISTLHSNTAYETINRIVSFFDPVERDLVRLQLRDAVRCIVCQRLIPKEGGGRLPALEFLFNDIKAINDGILSGNSDMIRIGMQQTGSHSFIFEESLYRMLKAKSISQEVAETHATDPSILDQMIMGTYSVPRLDSIKHHS